MSFEKSSGAAQVDVSVLQQIAGGKIKVSTEAAMSHVMTFEGQTALVFGFQCFRIGVDDGIVRLSVTYPAKPLGMKIVIY